MKDQALVSIIIPTYGRCDTLNLAVQSVLKQDYKNIEVLVIDDNDNPIMSKKVRANLSEYQSDPRLKYFSDGVNRGGAGARNKGIELSIGYYITFLDDDDLFLENKISKQIDFLEKEQLDVCLCDMYFKQGDRFIKKSNCYANGTTLKEFILKGNCYTPMIMCKRHVLIDIGGFVLTPRFQDHLLMIRILSNTSKVGHLSEQLFVHNNHNGERITYSNKSAEAYILREKMEREYIYLLNSNERK
ncbi:glycosyltransferase family 2 protein, partial [Escherichia coli]|nr:glycosyltransferase family 2 protein [Escherichia coli]EFJ8950564.1 glycosyltransferase family 2 protein [Escherichia coli]